jgi:tetratricopeptide (TPR) repeat protein
MAFVSTEDLLLAALWEQSATSPGDGSPLDTVVETIAGGGDRLSKQVEVAVATERLIEAGVLGRETHDGREYLYLAVADRGQRARETLSESALTVITDDQRESLTVGELSARVDDSLVTVGAACSDDGVYRLGDASVGDGLIDRVTEQDRWSSVFERSASDQHGAVVLVEGPGGIGKTTLADEMVDTVTDKARIGRASCQRDSTEPYRPLRNLLDAVSSENPLESTGPGGAPDVATGIDETDAYEAQRVALFHDITTALVLNDERTVIFLDDIGRADESTLAYLDYLVDRLPDLPLVLLGTHRPGTTPADSALTPDNVPDDVDSTHITLDRFDRAETELLIERVVGRRGVPDDFVDAVFAKTGGTPMFVKSTVEALLDSDRLDTQFQWYPETADEISLPDAVHDTVLQRVAALDDRSRDILAWVALSSDLLPVDVLGDLVDGTHTQVTRSIQILVDAAVLERSGDGALVSLRSNVIREALQAEETDDQASRHRRLAEALAAHTDLDADGAWDETTDLDIGDATAIAHHYERGDDPERAIPWYQQAAERATEIYAHETAIEHYHRVLALARDRDRQAVLAAGEELATIHATLGDGDQARQYIQFVRERLDPSDTTRRQRLARSSARLASSRSDFETARDEIDEGLALDDSPTEQRCRLLLARIEHELPSDGVEGASETLDMAIDIAETLVDPTVRAYCRMNQGWLAESTASYATARDHYESALETFETADSRHNAAHLQNALGNLVRKQGLFDDARSYHESALRTHEEVGDRHAIAITLNNLGLVAWRQSDYDSAREYFEESIDIGTQLRDEFNVARRRHNLANVFREQGDYDRASALYEEALPVFEENDSGHMVAIARHDMAKLATRRGRYETAREYCTGALSTYEANDHDHHASAARNVLGLVSTKLGAYADALQYFDTALELASGIGNDALQGKIHANWSVLAVERGETADAEDHAERALDRLGAARNRWFMGRAHLSLARASADEDALDAAMSHADEARAAFEAVGARHGVARASVVRGCLLEERSAVDRAREQYDTARETFEDIGAVGDLLTVLQSLVRLETAQNEHERRREYCELALEEPDEADSDRLREKRQWFEDGLSRDRETE